MESKVNPWKECFARCREEVVTTRALIAAGKCPTARKSKVNNKIMV